MNKNFKIFFIFLNIVVLLYIFYRSEFIHNGENRLYYLKYYIIFILALSYSLINYFYFSTILQYFNIFSLSIIFSLYLFEFYNIYWMKHLKASSYEKKYKKKFDTRTNKEVYLDLKNDDVDVIVSVPPYYFLKEKSEIIPLSGHSKINTLYSNENGYPFRIKSDRYGFNNPNEEWDKKNYEYINLGDSFVYGLAVNRPNDISSVLRKISNKPVLNLGVIGTGSLIQLGILKEFSYNKKSKNILWFYYEENDLIDLRNELKNSLLQNYLTKPNFKQNLLNKQSLVDKMIFNKFEKQIIREDSSEIFKFIKLYNFRKFLNGFFLPAEELEIPKEFSQIVKEFNKFSIEKNSKLYFIYLPDYFTVKSGIKSKNFFKIKSIVQNENVTFIDILDNVFLKEKNPLDLFPFGMAGHYNEEGYSKIANYVFLNTK